MLATALRRGTATLRNRITELVPSMRTRIANLKKEHGAVQVDTVNIKNIINGLVGVKALVCQTSRADPQKGILYRGLTLEQVRRRVPSTSQEPYAEGVFWLLLTGEVPSVNQAEELRQELIRRSEIPPSVVEFMRNLPADTHPMTAFSMGVMALQPWSSFDKAYHAGIRKTEYWEPTLDDALDLLAKLPKIAAMIYNKNYRNGEVGEYDPKLDLVGNFAKSMGFEDPDFHEFLRLYFLVHADHEGGAVVTHTTLNVASALSDPFKSYAAGLNGLAGPLHGLMHETALRFIMDVYEKYGENATEAQIQEFALEYLTLNEKIPGYGHKVLKVRDPRFDIIDAFAKQFIPDSKYYKFGYKLINTISPLLSSRSRNNNIHEPTMYAVTGPIFQHYGLAQPEFTTVMFGVARSIGATAQLVWNRATMMAIERPDSLTLEDLMKYARPSGSQQVG